MRTSTTILSFSLLFTLAAADPSSNGGGNAPTSSNPAQQASGSSLSSTEQCLAPPSQQAANRRYLRQVQILECENYHASQAAAAAAVNTATNYNAEEVDARNLGAVDDIVPADAFPDMPQLAGLDTYEMLNPDADYADFLRGIEAAPSGPLPLRMPTLGSMNPANVALPDGALPLLVGALILALRAATGSRRRRPEQQQGDDVGMKVRMGEGEGR